MAQTELPEIPELPEGAFEKKGSGGWFPSQTQTMLALLALIFGYAHVQIYWVLSLWLAWIGSEFIMHSVRGFPLRQAPSYWVFMLLVTPVSFLFATYGIGWFMAWVIGSFMS